MSELRAYLGSLKYGRILSLVLRELAFFENRIIVGRKKEAPRPDNHEAKTFLIFHNYGT